MDTLLGPAISLMQRLRFPQKFALVSLLFSIPIALLLVLYLGEVNGRITFAQQERAGLAYLRPLRTLLEHALRPELAQGGPARDPALDARIDADMQALVAVDRRLGAGLGTGTQVAELQASWEALRSQGAADGGQSYSQLVDQIMALMSTVGDSSNLILDPDLDSYYLMDMLLLKLPEAQVLSARLLPLGARAARDSAAGVDELAQIVQMRGLIQAHITAIGKGAMVVFRSTTYAQLQPVLEAQLAVYSGSAEAYLLASDRLNSAVQIATHEPQRYRGLADTALQSGFALWDDAADNLAILLDRRVARLAQGRLLALSVTGTILALVLLVWVVFYRALMTTVGRLVWAADEMGRGGFGASVRVDGRDELAEVVRSFNTIAAALVASSAQRQAVLDNAVDSILTVDADGCVLSANPAAEELFGRRAAALVGQPFAQIIPPPHSQQYRNVGAGRPAVGRRADGSDVSLDLAVSEMAVAAGRQFIVIAHDLSEHQRAAEERAQLQEQIIQAQSLALAELANPLIPISDRVVVMPLVGALDGQRIGQMQETLLQGIEERHATTAILDVTGVPVIDTHVASGLLQAAKMARLCGAQVILTGIRPEVAQTIVGLGLDLSDLLTHSTLQSGIAYATRP